MKKVWYRKSDSCWYATMKEGGQRKQIKLVKAPENREGRLLAEKQLVQELASRHHEEEVPVDGAWITVGHVLDGFLKHSHEEHEESTCNWYKNFFDTFRPKYGKLRISQLRKQHVFAWTKSRKFNPTSANRAIGALKRAFNWAVEEEYIARNPISHIRKPTSVLRDRILDPDERNLILASIRDEAFRDFVKALTLTGCRPGEIARVTKDDILIDQGVWLLRKHKTAKKTGRPRVIYLCPEAVELTKRLLAKNPDGPIFRNRRGRPWRRNAIRNRFRNLRAKFPQLKGIVAYTYRSSFATDALEAGVPDATVAELLGHTNTNTLHRFYARLSHKVEHLKNAAEKATQPPATGDAQPDNAA